MRNDPYTHFSQQPHNKLMWLIIFYYFFCFVLFSFCKKIRKMLNLQHQHNNHTTTPHMRVDPHTGTHSHVRGCCVVVVMVLCMNQIPKNNKILPATSACCGAVVRNECRDHFSYKIVCKENIIDYN
jgi:hypothetical protein